VLAKNSSFGFPFGLVCWQKPNVLFVRLARPGMKHNGLYIKRWAFKSTSF